MPLDYMATGFSRWGSVVFRMLPYVLKKKKKPESVEYGCPMVFFLHEQCTCMGWHGCCRGEEP